MRFAGVSQTCVTFRRCLATVTCVALGCAPRPRAASPPLPPLVIAPPPSAGCDLAATERREALRRLRAGQWFAALRRLERANASCPEQASQSAEQVEATKKKLADGHGGDPEVLLGRAHTARRTGDRDAARLLEDQAAYGLEAKSGATLMPSVPVTSDSRVEAFWSADSEWLLERSGQGLSRRRRGDWYPRWWVPGFSDQSNDNAHASPDLGALLVADNEWTSDEDDDGGKRYWVTLVDVSASEHFGNVRARFDVARGAEESFSPDGRVFAFAQAAPDNRSSAPRSFFSWASTANGQVEHRIDAPGAGESVRAFRFDRQSRRALVQWQGGPVSMVELATGRAVHLAGPASDQYLHDAPFSPDGRFAVWPLPRAGAVRELMLFDTAKGTGRRLNAAPCDAEQGLSFDPDSRLLTLGGELGATCSLELESGRMQRRSTAPKPPANTAPSYAFALPLGARVVPSPNGQFLALNDRYSSQLFAAGASAQLTASPLTRADPHLVPLGGARFGIVNDPRQWLWSPEAGLGPFSPVAPTDACSFAARLGPGRHKAWFDNVDYDYAQQGLVDCKSGERTRPLDSRISAFALVEDTRLVTSDPDQHEAGLLWDLTRQKVIGHFSFPGSSAPTDYALTSDDRYLAAGSAIWDLERSELVAKLPILVRDVAAFGKHTLLAEHAGLITIHHAPEFALAGTLVLSADGTALAVFGYGRDGRPNAIEVLGPEQAWDTTFACSVGSVGVPFRICREALERPGLLRALLE